MTRNHYLVTIIALLISFSSYGEYQVLFRCKTPFNPYNMEFQQGSEIYINIYYDSEKNLSYLQSIPAVGEKKIILTKEESLNASVDLDTSTAVFHWLVDEQNILASLVYLGDQWGMVLPLSPVIYSRDPSLEGKSEASLFCDETDYFVETFITTN